VLTTLDKLLLALFTLGSIVFAFAGGWLVFCYADPILVSDLDTIGTGKNVSLTGALLVLAGMALGYSLALVISGTLSRRFASAETHRRWAEFLDPDSLGLRRYPGVGKLLIVTLIPEEYRLPPNAP
jgi:hypothetical protein